MSALERKSLARHKSFSHCRFCAIQKDTEELLNLTVILQKYTNILSYIKLELDLSDRSKLPKHACFVCYNKCLETFNFCITVKKSQKLLMKLYESDSVQDCVNKIEIKSEIDDPDEDIQKSFDKVTIRESKYYTEQHEIKESKSSLLPKDELDDINDEIDSSYNEVGNLCEDGNNSDDQGNSSNEEHIESKSNLELKTWNVEFDNTNEEHENSNEVNNLKQENLVFYENFNEEFNYLKEEHHNLNELLVDSFNHDTVDNNILSIDVITTNCGNFNSSEVKNNNNDIRFIKTHGRTPKRYINKNDAKDIEIRKSVSHIKIINYALETGNEAGQNKNINTNSSAIQDINVNKNISSNTVEIKGRKRKYVDTDTGNEVAIKHKIEINQMIYTDGDNIKTDLVTAQNDETISTAINNNKYVNNTDIETNQGTKNTDENAVPEKGEIDDLKENSSWADYPWSCDICKEKSGSRDEAREHSKHVHNYCYGYSCVDCDKDLNTYNTFVEHVRSHRQHLRLYCQYCNQKFEDATECFEHSLEHWTGPQTICELCGEIFPNESRLASHRKAYKHKPLNKSTKRKQPKLILRFGSSTWKDYVWSCLDCFKVLPDLQSLRIHIRAVHRRCFAMKCSDCLRVLYDFTAFVNHVREHRPYLHHICHYCDEYVHNEDLKTHIEQHFTNENPCYGCGEIFPNKELLQQHMVDFEAPTRHTFLKYKDYTCNVCHNIFKSITSLKKHNIIHDKLESAFICAVCGNRFYNRGNFENHLKSHDAKTEICEVCHKRFATKSYLNKHAKTHIMDKLFPCDVCKKCFKNKWRVRSHMLSHTDVKPFLCVVCDKRFKTNSALNNHRNQHTGLRPYKCEICDKTFTNSPNCNKHMIRKHGVPFYKSKNTSIGKIEIDKESGKVKDIAIDENAKEWLSKVTARSKAGRKKKTQE